MATAGMMANMGMSSPAAANVGGASAGVSSAAATPAAASSVTGGAASTGASGMGGGGGMANLGAGLAALSIGLETGQAVAAAYTSHQDTKDAIKALKASVQLNAFQARENMVYQFKQFQHNASVQMDASTREMFENSVRAAQDRATAKAMAAENGASGASVTALAQRIAAKQGRFVGYVRDQRAELRRSVELQQEGAFKEARQRIESFITPKIKKNSDFGVGLNMTMKSLEGIGQFAGVAAGAG